MRFLLLAVGFWSYLPQSRLVISLMILPNLLPCAVSFSFSFPFDRDFFQLISFGFLIVVRGAMQVAGWVFHRWKSEIWQDLDPSVVGTAPIVVIMLSNVCPLGFFCQYPKPDYQGALPFVEGPQSTEDIVMIAGQVVMRYRDYFDKK